MKIKPNYQLDEDSKWYYISRNCKRPALVRRCPICHEDYLTKKSDYREGITCCGYSCAAKHKAARGVGSPGLPLELHPSWKGCGTLTASQFNNYRWMAKERDIAWDITIEEGWAQYERQNGNCALSGLAIGFTRWGRKKAKRGTASLDRIDNEKGYTPDNIWWIHKHLNQSKWNFSLPHFLSLCRAVSSHVKKN